MLVFKDAKGQVVEDDSAYEQEALAQGLDSGCLTVERWYKGELIETRVYEVKSLGVVKGGERGRASA